MKDNSSGVMPWWERLLWNILVGKRNSVPVFTSRRSHFFRALDMLWQPQMRHVYKLDGRWTWFRYLVRQSLRSHKHDIDRMFKPFKTIKLTRR